jgi:hypothetical protein
MKANRKSHCQTGCLNAAERRDARERRSVRVVEKVMDDFFNIYLELLRHRVMLADDKYGACLRTFLSRFLDKT